MIYRIIKLSDSIYSGELYRKAYLAMTYERQAKADRYKQEADKRCCVFADMLLRDMLREHYSLNAPEFYTDEKGKPHIKGDKVHFSISHSGDLVACCVDSSPVGIDIERIRTVDSPLINRVCTQEELAFVLNGTQNIDENTSLRFLNVWCAKEAYLKYTGEGIKGGLKCISTADKKGIKTNPLPHIRLETHTTQRYVCAIVSET